MKVFFEREVFYGYKIYESLFDLNIVLVFKNFLECVVSVKS